MKDPIAGLQAANAVAWLLIALWFLTSSLSALRSRPEEPHTGRTSRLRASLGVIRDAVFALYLVRQQAWGYIRRTAEGAGLDSAWMLDADGQLYAGMFLLAMAVCLAGLAGQRYGWLTALALSLIVAAVYLYPGPLGLEWLALWRYRGLIAG